VRGFSRTSFYLCGAVALGIGAAVACDVYNSSLLRNTGTGGSGGSGGSGGGGGTSASAGTGGSAGSAGDGGLVCNWGDCWWSKTDPVTGCHDVGMPTAADRPKPTGGSDIPPIYLGVTHLWVGQSSPQDAGTSLTAYEYFGLDLDGTCTNPAGCSNAKKTGVVSCKAPVGVPPDGFGCRDNMFAKLDPLAAQIPVTKPFGVAQSAYNCSFFRGSFNIIIKISGYNGTANDDTVRVDAYMSPGLETLPSWTCATDPTPQKDQAPWLPNNPWYVDQGGLSGPITTAGQLPPAKTIFDANAYVRQGYLVAQFPDGIQLHFPGDDSGRTPPNSVYPGFSLIIYGGEVVGHLHKNAESLWALDDALVVGRIKTTDLLQGFRLIGACPNTIGCSYYGTLTSFLGTYPDIMADGGAFPSSTCDALSVGFAVQASVVTPGHAFPVQPQVECVPPPGVATDAGPADGNCP
jgi:hypothetical protein